MCSVRMPIWSAVPKRVLLWLIWLPVFLINYINPTNFNPVLFHPTFQFIMSVRLDYRISVILTIFKNQIRFAVGDSSEEEEYSEQPAPSSDLPDLPPLSGSEGDHVCLALSSILTSYFQFFTGPQI